jgi:hypothetical protein
MSAAVKELVTPTLNVLSIATARSQAEFTSLQKSFSDAGVNMNNFQQLYGPTISYIQYMMNLNSVPLSFPPPTYTGNNRVKDLIPPFTALKNALSPLQNNTAIKLPPQPPSSWKPPPGMPPPIRGISDLLARVDDIIKLLGGAASQGMSASAPATSQGMSASAGTIKDLVTPTLNVMSIMNVSSQAEFTSLQKSFSDAGVNMNNFQQLYGMTTGYIQYMMNLNSVPLSFPPPKYTGNNRLKDLIPALTALKNALSPLQNNTAIKLPPSPPSSPPGMPSPIRGISDLLARVDDIIKLLGGAASQGMSASAPATSQGMSAAAQAEMNRKTASAAAAQDEMNRKTASAAAAAQVEMNRKTASAAAASQRLTASAAAASQRQTASAAAAESRRITASAATAAAAQAEMDRRTASAAAASQRQTASAAAAESRRITASAATAAAAKAEMDKKTASAAGVAAEQQRISGTLSELSSSLKAVQSTLQAGGGPSTATRNPIDAALSSYQNIMMKRRLPDSIMKSSHMEKAHRAVSDLRGLKFQQMNIARRLNAAVKNLNSAAAKTMKGGRGKNKYSRKGGSRRNRTRSRSRSRN